jgi:hypothetical protein
MSMSDANLSLDRSTACFVPKARQRG